MRKRNCRVDDLWRTRFVDGKAITTSAEEQQAIAKYMYEPQNILKCETCPFNVGEGDKERGECGMELQDCWVRLYIDNLI